MRATSIILLFLFATRTLVGQVVVVANADVPVSQISKNELLDVYTGDVTAWDNGDPVVVFDLRRDEDVRSVFYDYIGRSSSRMKTIWLRRKLAGEGDPPRALESSDDLLALVAQTPGAIGYVEQRVLPQGVKLLEIIQPEN